MPITAISYALQLLTELPGLIQAGTDVMGALTKGREKLTQFQAEKRDPTPQEWAELNEQISALRSELHKP
jgi:hypothetical protein